MIDSVGESQAADDSRSGLEESRLSRISSLANEIYEDRGGKDGMALEDWLRAEREIDAQSE
jgi:hypothetical protein